MNGYDEFIGLFGDITVLNVARFILAAAFLFFVARKIRDYLIKKHDAESEKNEQLKQALEAISRYPEYRQQSIKVQKELEAEIQELRDSLKENTRIVMDNMGKIAQMEQDTKRRERNKLQDRLLQSYKFYTSTEHNPMQAWTKMEAQAFWELFGDYEKLDGDGYIHSVVQPAMTLLATIEMDDAENVAKLIQNRK